MITRCQQLDFRFFHANAGGIVGQRAIGAWELVKAEQAAYDREWFAEWGFDDDGDLGDHDYWCRKDCGKDHSVEVCLLRDQNRKVLAALGGIIDPDRSYRRVIEAELAAEALAEEARAWGQCAHAS